jgi:hypothetical protein
VLLNESATISADRLRSNMFVPSYSHLCRAPDPTTLPGRALNHH